MLDKWKPKRAKGIITQKVGEELLIYSAGNTEVHCVGPQLAQIWELCDGERTLSDIVSSLEANQPDVASSTPVPVPAVLQDLISKNLLEEPDEATGHILRRDLLKHAALLPLVLSVNLPQPAAAMSAMSPCINGLAALNGCGDPNNLGLVCETGGPGDCVDCRCGSFRFTSGTSCDTDIVLGFTCVDFSVPPLFGSANVSCAVARLAASTHQTTYSHCSGFFAQTGNAPPGQFAYVCSNC